MISRRGSSLARHWQALESFELFTLYQRRPWIGLHVENIFGGFELRCSIWARVHWNARNGALLENIMSKGVQKAVNIGSIYFNRYNGTFAVAEATLVGHLYS